MNYHLDGIPFCSGKWKRVWTKTSHEISRKYYSNTIVRGGITFPDIPRRGYRLIDSSITVYQPYASYLKIFIEWLLLDLSSVDFDIETSVY